MITDPQYHYEAVNVEAQRRNPTSLWWWMRRMIALRQQHPVFARGSMQMIESDNPKVLTFLRSLDGDSPDVPDDVLVVANLSRHPQQVNIPLAGFEGMRPVELNSRNALAPVESTPYRLMLGPHDVYWLQLRRARRRRPTSSSRQVPARRSATIDSSCRSPATTPHSWPRPCSRTSPASGGSATGHGRSPRPRWSTRSRWPPAWTVVRPRGASACRWSSTPASPLATSPSCTVPTGSGTTRSSIRPSPANWRAPSCAAARSPVVAARCAARRSSACG